MKTAGDILAANGQEVWTIPSTATVFEALKLMSEKNIGALPVKDRGKGLVGIISERDYARKVVLAGKSSRETRVKEIMTPAAQMVTVRPDAGLDACMSLMTIHHVRHLPVLAKERLIGVISSRDVIEAVIDEKNGHIDNLARISETVFVHSFDDDLRGVKS